MMIKSKKDMSILYDTICPKCGAKLTIHEQGAVGMAGCYEREDANCPVCNTIVGSKRTDGVLIAEL